MCVLFPNRIPWKVPLSVSYIERILIRVHDSLLSLTQSVPRILEAVRTPLWRTAPSAYFLPPALWLLGLQSAEIATSQDSRSLATVSCSSISFYNVCQFHAEKINLWFYRCHHFPNFPGLTRNSLHLPILVPRSQSILQKILYSLSPSIPFLFLEFSYTTVMFHI